MTASHSSLWSRICASRITRGLFAASAAGGLAWAVAQSQATSPIGSYLELVAQVVGPVGTPTLNSTTDVTGGDQVRWTALMQSRLDAPANSEGELTLPRDQAWVSGSLKAPDNVSFSWLSNGTWVDKEPASGAPVSAVKWKQGPQYTAKMVPLNGAVDFSGTGDGVRVIPFKDRLYVINHGNPNTYFNCRSATTGSACPGFEGGGLGFEEVPGTKLRANSKFYTGVIPLEAVNYKTGELFAAVTSSGNERLVLCTNLDSLTSCGKWSFGVSADAGSGAWHYTAGLETIGSEYFFRNAEGELLCFDIDKKASCGRWKVGIPSGLTPSIALDGKLFFGAGTTATCFDPKTKSKCVGWESPKANGGGNIFMYPLLHSTGKPRGVCLDAASCFGVDGSTIGRPAPGYYQFLADSVYSWKFNTTAVHGTRFFMGFSSAVGDTIRSGPADSVKCFDFKTDSSCGTVPSTERIPYTTRMDATRPGCVLALGDMAQANLFDATTLGPCKGSLTGVLPDIDVNPAPSYACDSSRARVRAWGKVRMNATLPWGGSDGLSAVVVTLKDAKGAVLPEGLNPVRQFAPGTYELSIADVPYTLYPTLKVGLELKTPGAFPPDMTYGIDVTWDGDPQQVCVSTKMPVAPDCQMKADLRVSSSPVDDTSGVWQETLKVSTVLSPGGLSNGYAAVATPTSPRAVLSDLGPRDPKTYVMQGRWALQYFSGDLWAFGLDANGQINSSTHLSAQDATAAPAARPMFTGPAAATGAQAVQALAWGSLTPSQQVAVGQNLSGLNDGKGAARLDYLRGTDGGFRARAGKTLGPIISSSPAMLLPAATLSLNERNYPGYTAYRANVTRPFPMALYGANDGALHAYEVRPGSLREAWSFVPDVMLRRAANYADPTITGIRANPYFVDNIPMVGHVNTGGANGWRAVAVVTYGRGARAITALDVTSADLAQGKGVLFEYSNVSDPELKDLGYIISQPVANNAMVSQQMVQLAAGAGRRSAVLVGNGINSNDGQGGAAASGTGKPVLYAFYLDQGGAKRWQRWAVDELWAGAASEPGLTANNGLSTPTPVDVDGDGRVDVVYAGDLQGNLWRFDVRDPAAPSVTRLFKTEAQQPITQAPFVTLNTQATGCGASDADAPLSAKRCWQVVFSTGAPISPLLGSANVATQSIYGVLDKGTGASVARGSLTAIPYEVNQLVKGVEYRALKPTTVSYKSGSLGWVVDLQAYEHGVGAPRQQPTGLVMFSSIRPTTPDKAINVCIGPRSWLNELDPINGYSTLVPFDTNGDGNIDGQDRLNPDSSTPLSPVGMAISGAQFGPPAVLQAASTQAQQMSLLLPSLGQDTGQANSWSGGTGSGGNSPAPGSNSAALTHANPAKLGRMSWREKY